MQPPFRKNLLAASIEFICRYWRYPTTISDERIGQAVNAALALKEAAE